MISKTKMVDIADIFDFESPSLRPVNRVTAGSGFGQMSNPRTVLKSNRTANHVRQIKSNSQSCPTNRVEQSIMSDCSTLELKNCLSLINLISH